MLPLILNPLQIKQKLITFQQKEITIHTQAKQEQLIHIKLP